MKIPRKQVSIYMSEQTIAQMVELRDTLDVETNSRLIEMLIESKLEEVKDYMKLFAKHKFS